MSSILHTRALPAVLLLALAACDASGPAAPTLPAPAPEGASSSITLRCFVSVSDAEMRCEPAGPGGARGDLMLGGQGTYVRLASTNVSYNGGTQTLQGDVTVQNLLSEALGTPDGSTVTGVKVFFLTGPTVTSGTGTADVQNADGTGTFTTTNQPYFLYNQVLLPRGTSAAKTWKFDVSPTVGTFAFTVAVSGKAPSEAGALRWTVQNGTPGTEHADAVWGTSPSNVFVGAQGGVIKHWDGTSWTELVTAAAKNVDCIHGASPTDVWAVGDFGLAEHYDGNSWTATPVPAGAYLFGVWDAGGGIAYAVGINGLALRWNGSAWSTQPTPAGTPYLWAVWGASATNVFAVGQNGTILHYDGVSWTGMTSGTANTLYGIWGTGPSNVWAVGVNGTILHYDGVSWSSVSGGGSGLYYAVYGTSATDVWAVGNFGAAAHYDGVSWSTSAGLSGNTLRALWSSADGHYFGAGDQGLVMAYDPATSKWSQAQTPGAPALFSVAVVADSDVWAGGYGGLVMHWNGTAWSTTNAGVYVGWYGAWYDGAGTVYLAGDNGYIRKTGGGGFVPVSTTTGQTLSAIWGSSPTDIFVVGNAGTIQHSAGGSFGAMTSGTTNWLFGVWGSSGTDVFAVGNGGTVLHYDGVSWSPMATPTTTSLYAVSGTSHSNVWAVGFNGTVLHYDGTSWTIVPTPGISATLRGVYVSPAGGVYVTGSGGTLLRYDGTAWRSFPGASVYLYAVTGTSDKNLWVMGDDQLVLRGQR